jgi:hypothetical protein
VLARFDLSLSITPAPTALTRMPRCPSGEAGYLASVSMAPLVLAQPASAARAPSDEECGSSRAGRCVSRALLLDPSP